MEQKLLTLFARTPIHVGAGNSVGAIDAPIARERHTRIPILPGSALKGVLADMWPALPEAKGKSENPPEKTPEQKEREMIFGKEDWAGQLLVGEARVLAFPLRSARGAFAWVTCPLALQRFVRDSGKTLPIPALPDGQDQMFCAGGNEILVNGKSVVLEEYVFTQCAERKADLEAIEAELLKLADDSVWSLLKGHLAVISDEMFSYFVENACEVVTRIRIDDKTGTVAQGALFNQEQLPSETLLYAVLGWQMRSAAKWDALQARLAANGDQLQIGGDETVGLGYCSVKLM